MWAHNIYTIACPRTLLLPLLLSPHPLNCKLQLFFFVKTLKSIITLICLSNFIFPRPICWLVKNELDIKEFLSMLINDQGPKGALWGMPFLLLEVECGGIGVLLYMSCWLPSRNSSSSFNGNLLAIPSLFSSFLVLKLKLVSPLFFIPTSWIKYQVNFCLNHYPSKITSPSGTGDFTN